VVLPSPNENDWLAAWQAAERKPLFFSDDPHVWRMLAAAWQRGTVEFRYWGGSEPGAWRRVTPEAVFTVAGSAGIYVEGDCHLRAERREFRPDRVEWPGD
jgi:predicted DNA-binding transcriptional regulator YafY